MHKSGFTPGAALILLLTLILSACSGGGGSGGNSLTVHLSPSPLTGTFYPNQLPATLSVDATISGATSASTIYVVVDDSGTTFEPGSVGASPETATSYIANLQTLSDLAPGVHSGTLGIQLCNDAKCKSKITKTSLPYSISITMPKVSALSPGNIVASVVPNGIIQLTASIDGVTSDSKVYASIQDSADNFTSMSGAPMTMQSPGTYQINALASGSISATSHSGNLSVTICGDSACTLRYGSGTLKYSVQAFEELAGMPAQCGHKDGTGSSALLNFRIGDSISYDHEGNLYLAESLNQDIRKIAPDGSTTTVYSRKANGDPIPSTIAIDKDDNIFFGIDSSSAYGLIYKLDSSGNAIVFSAGGSSGLSIDSAGNVYSTDYTNRFVYKSAPDGTLLNFTPSISFQSPAGVAVDQNDSLWLADVQANKVYRLDSTGHAAAVASITFPWMIAIDSSGNALVTANTISLGNSSYLFVGTLVYKVTSGGDMTTIVPGGLVFQTGELMDGLGIAVTPDNKLALSGKCVVLRTTMP